MRAASETAASSDDRATLLRDTLSGWLAPVVVSARGDGPLSGSAHLRRFGYLRLITQEAGPLRLTRNARMLARRSGDAVALVLPRAGTARLTQDGRAASLAPGELALLDLRAAFTYEQAEGARVLIYRVPAHALNVPQTAVRSVTGRAVPAAEGVAALLAPLLLSLDEPAAPIPDAAGDGLGGVVTEFVAALVHELTENDASRGAGRDELLRAVRAYIERNLHDPGLAPERIAAEHRISVRYLHRLFEVEGVTVSRLIQQSRVERCARELERRERVGRSIAAVALRWGFRSPAHFSRAFKAVYGHSPRQWRARQSEGDIP
ncbi:helix-turn-helix domain-containing protein [Streptomyces longispororuber]|uniref:helix-turn-helix domain-containing protein n=1 Tax=Streptomyces longispororuber TaxID=68230 RepID=UPI0036FD583E